MHSFADVCLYFQIANNFRVIKSHSGFRVEFVAKAAHVVLQIRKNACMLILWCLQVGKTLERFHNELLGNVMH